MHTCMGPCNSYFMHKAQGAPEEVPLRREFRGALNKPVGAVNWEAPGNPWGLQEIPMAEHRKS